MSRNLNKNKEVSLILYLIRDLDPFFFESLIDTIGNSNNVSLILISRLTPHYFKNIIFLNILSTEIISNKLNRKLTEEKIEKNLVYTRTKQLNNSKLFYKNIKHQLENIFFFNLKNTKYNASFSSETSNLIKIFKNYILI